MAFVLPLPLDLQLKINGMVKIEQDKLSMLDELQHVHDNLWNRAEDVALHNLVELELDDEHDEQDEHILKISNELLRGSYDREDFMYEFVPVTRYMFGEIHNLKRRRVVQSVWTF